MQAQKKTEGLRSEARGLTLIEEQRKNELLGSYYVGTWMLYRQGTKEEDTRNISTECGMVSDFTRITSPTALMEI